MLGNSNLLKIGDDEVICLQICDQCNSRRIKCSRTFPKCAHCQSRGIECTYLRKTRKTPKMIQHPEFYARSTVFHREGLEHFPRNSKTIKADKKLKLPSYLSPTTVAIKKHRSDIAVRVVHEWPFQGWVSFLMVALNFPVLETRPTVENEMFMTLFSSVSSGNKAIKKQPALPIDVFNSNNFISPILSSAVDAYFKYVNNFLPLFSQRAFMSRPRSRLLLMAVWASGLHFLPKTAVTTNLANYIQDKVYEGIKKCYYKVSFENVQVLLVTLHGLQHYKWALNSAWLCCSVTLSMAHALGLHSLYSDYSYGFQDTDHIIERQFAFNSILYFNSVRSWLMDAGCNYITDSVSPFYESNSELSSHFPLLSNPLLLRERNRDFKQAVREICELIISDCQVQSSYILVKLRVTRYEIINATKAAKRVLSSLNLCKKRLQDITIHFIQKLHVVKTRVETDYQFQGHEKDFCLQYIQTSINLLDLHYQSNFKDIVSLYLHLPIDLELPASRQPLTSATPRELFSAFEASTRIFSIDSQFYKEPYNAHRITTLSRAIIFLIKNHRKHPCQSNVLASIKKGRDRIVELSQISTFGSHCFFNLMLVDSFLKSSHIDLNFV